MKCKLCFKKNNSYICEGCWDKGYNQISDLPTLYVSLEDELIPSKGYNEKVQTSKTPPLPVRIDVLHLRVGGISKILQNHEKNVRNLQRHSDIKQKIGSNGELDKIKNSVEYLMVQWNWIKENYPNAEGLLGEIFNIFNQIQIVMGNKSEEIIIGNCPSIDEKGKTCNSKLKINPYQLSVFGDIKCSKCATVWESTKWRLLGQIIENSKESGL